MIIIEGCDGAGKTTLKDALLKRYPNMREGPRGTRDRALLYTVTVPDTFGAINRAVRATGTHQGPPGGARDLCVWDRLFFSEMVYADLVGRPCQFSPGQQDFIHRVLEAIGCPIILCQPPFQVVEENAKVHEQMKGVNENLGKIWARYHRLYFGMPNQTIIYDYTENDEHGVDFDQVIATIDAYLAERSKREWSPA